MGLRAAWKRLRTRWRRYLVYALAVFLIATVLPVLLLRWIDPWTSAVMLGDRVDALLGGDFKYANRYDWVNLEDISPQAAIAVIASEDQLFPFHAGFDFKSIREAVRHNAHSKRVRGASTISQQVAKNLFLWRGRSWVRKGLEVWYTLLIEWLWPKERILETYLNIAEMGTATFGVEAAAQNLFHKPARKLTRRQAALLAAVLPNPKRFHAEAPSPYVNQRADFIQGQMRALGGASYLNQLKDNEEPGSGR
jgi:monofunctional biosynthetic peptidoglycan transglycosylase